MSREMTHGSLFTGVGGFDLGAERAGIRTLWSCEVEEHKRKVLRRHFPETYQYEDITTMPDNPPYVDIMSGGFPCQDISIANGKKRDDPTLGIRGERSGLWREYARILGAVRPRYVLFENSPMLLVRRGFERVLCDLSRAGYSCQWTVLSAEAFGFPHIRKRLYAVAYSLPVGCEVHLPVFRELPEVLRQGEGTGQDDVPMPIKRYDGKTDYSRVRMDDGFSRELDKRRIEDMGNAVIPKIAQYVFECVKAFDKEIQAITNNKTK